MNSTFTLSNDEKLPIDEDTQVKHEEDVGNQTAIITKNPEEEIVNPEVNHVTETNLPSSSSEMNASSEQTGSSHGAQLNDTMTIETRALNESYTVEPTVPDADHKNTNNQRHHVRRNTITLEAGGLSKEIADVIKEVIEGNPSDYKEILKEKLTAFTLQKEEEWRENYEKAVAKANAQLEMKLANTIIETEPLRDSTFSLPKNSHVNLQMEQAMRERDQFKDQIVSTMRTVNEQAKQHEFFMEKSQRYEKELEQFRNEQKVLEDSIIETHNRYNALLREAEQHAIEIDENVALINKEHDEATIALRYKVRQQELKIKSLTGMVDSLTSEKNELIEMCDGLVSEVDRKTAATLDEVAAPEVHLDNQLDSIVEPSFTEEQDGIEDEAFVDAESELTTPESTKQNNSHEDDLGGF